MHPQVPHPPLLAAALALTLATTAPTSAAVVPYDLAGLSKRSDLIAAGTVVELKSYWAPYQDLGEIIVTDVTIRVERVIKGKPASSEVTVTILGGKLGTKSLLCLESARYEEGERVLVFLRELDGRLWNVGWHQGKYRVAPDGVTVRGDPRLPVAEDTHVEILRARIAAHVAAAASAASSATTPAGTAAAAGASPAALRAPGSGAAPAGGAAPAEGEAPAAEGAPTAASTQRESPRPEAASADDGGAP